MTPALLVVDDDAEMLRVLRGHFEREGYAVATAGGGREALKALRLGRFDVVLTDLVMDDVDGLALIRGTRRDQAAPRVVLMTAFATVETAIEAVRVGAYDYLTKPFKLGEATIAVNRARDDRGRGEENRRVRAVVEGRSSAAGLLGHCPPMRAVFEQIRAISASDATVLILGESGTGKELVARAIHRESGRRDGPFVAVNCAAIPETLLESELFGHEKGAFTGADRRRRGLFVEANTGTLFLDEVGDLTPPLQGKLLRALQEHSIRPVGAHEDVHLDLRVMSATHRDLSALAQHGVFRQDLYYRLAVIPIRLPSLRERTDDIMLLATHFLSHVATTLGKSLEGFDEDAAGWLRSHRWPGNVRELANAVERAVTLARGARITLKDLQLEFVPAEAPNVGTPPTLADLEMDYMRRIVAEAGGDKRTAARLLGVSVRTLQRRLK